MFPVVISIPDEDALAARMDTMRQWLDHQRFEPATFRYTFAARGLLFRVEFTVEAQALAFAKAFDGQLP
ncbi:MAG: hypothetical protein E6G81_07935 [Alphaproteobacteria bacterium]|nr:MAG: hypothetical protein E6G81_07935 [Alphaproteobacteria bacterium]